MDEERTDPVLQYVVYGYSDRARRWVGPMGPVVQGHQLDACDSLAQALRYALRYARFRVVCVSGEGEPLVIIAIG